MLRSCLLSCGSYLPEKILTNADLSRIVDTSDEWIVQRTGIKQRHIAADGELTSDMAIAAGREALERAHLSGQDIDLIVLATSTPDNTFPATAAKVQYALGASRAAAFDIQAVCSGFVYALSVADNFIKAGQSKTALVIGAETFSRILDWEDRTTCVLFGDGAGAVVIRAEEGTGEVADRGILSSHLYTDGKYYDALYVDGGVSLNQRAGHLRMKGNEVFRQAVSCMAEAIDQALKTNDISGKDIDWFIPHQANIRIIDALAKRLGLDRDQVIVSVDRHANTSAASIPLAMAEVEKQGRIKRGDLILLEGMGGGFTWGSVLLRW